MIELQFVTEPLFRGCRFHAGSALIRWFSAGPFSHVDAIIPEGIYGRPGWLVGARMGRVGGQPPGVWARPPNYAEFTRRTVARIPASDDQVIAFWRFVRAQIGKPYDTSAIWGFVAGRDWRSVNSWFCSEIFARALEPSRAPAQLVDVAPNRGGAGIFPQPLFLAANKLTPVGLANVLSAVPGVSFREL